MICPVFPRQRDGLSGVRLHQTPCSDHSGPPALCPRNPGCALPQPRQEPCGAPAGERSHLLRSSWERLLGLFGFLLKTRGVRGAYLLCLLVRGPTG